MDNKQQARTLQGQVTVPVSLPYLIYLPEEYDAQRTWPLLLYLHGSGERGADMELVKRHGPPKLIAEGQPFPFIVVSPQCAKFEGWMTKLHVLGLLLDEIESSYAVDTARRYVTGNSMGGYGTWGWRSPIRSASRPSRQSAEEAIPQRSARSKTCRSGHFTVPKTP
jgi:predicted peptidase